ncbi:hypothetical protein ABCR94_36085 [Streptomyces sp. 21So2-11]|uniref:hypothetical protein n=1 Tax=Streptomyces sp. 21So2-11 TaxID=3144408 RepID=UPI00321AD286
MAGTKARIRIALVKMHCKDTDDNLGGDNVYMAGGIICDGRRTAILTYPTGISDGQVIHLHQNEALVFQDEVLTTATIHVGIAAYREDFSKDWGKKYGPMLKAMTRAVDSVTPPPDGAGRQVIDAGEQARTGIDGVFASDMVLGTLDFHIPVAELHGGEKLWCFKGSSGLRNWDYEVTYRIAKTANSD